MKKRQIFLTDRFVFCRKALQRLLLYFSLLCPCLRAALRHLILGSILFLRSFLVLLQLLLYRSFLVLLQLLLCRFFRLLMPNSVLLPVQPFLHIVIVLLPLIRIDPDPDFLEDSQHIKKELPVRAKGRILPVCTDLHDLFKIVFRKQIIVESIQFVRIQLPCFFTGFPGNAIRLGDQKSRRACVSANLTAHLIPIDPDQPQIDAAYGVLEFLNCLFLRFREWSLLHRFLVFFKCHAVFPPCIYLIACRYSAYLHYLPYQS